MYKNIFKIVALLAVMVSTNIKAQVGSFSIIDNNLAETSYFLDASLMEGKAKMGLGKLLGFPRTDLTQFEFIPDTFSVTADHNFDGTIVYNSGTGFTKAGQGQSVEVTPGFYYFSNPTGASLATGQWVRFGSGEGSGSSTVEIVNNTENITNVTVDGRPVYSFKGSFVADGAKTQYSLSNFPSGVTGIYKITIYNASMNLYTNTVYSLSNTGALVTGAPSISTVYLAGTYNYIVEYFK